MRHGLGKSKRLSAVVPFFGETELKAEFENIRCNVLSAQRDINQLKIEVREMREKMYEHLSHTKEGFLISKQIVAALPILNLSPNI